eukprot:747421-Hanusia_phi.AAC.1
MGASSVPPSTANLSDTVRFFIPRHSTIDCIPVPPEASMARSFLRPSTMRKVTSGSGCASCLAIRSWSLSGLLMCVKLGS